MSRIGRTVCTLLAVGVVAAGTTACGSSNHAGGSTTASGGASTGGGTTSPSSGGGFAKKTRIAYLLATEAAGYPLGMKSAGEQVADKYNADIQFFDAQFDPTKQVGQCQDALTSGRFDVIVTLPAASPTMIPCARQAQAKNVPLIATNTPIGTDLTKGAPTVPGVTAQVLVPAATYADEGLKQQLLPAMCKKVKGTCTFAVIVGNQGLALTQPVVNDAKQLAQQNGWKLVGFCAGNYQRAGGVKCMQDFLQKAPDLNAVFSLSDDMMLGAQQVLEKAGRQVGKDVIVGTQGGSYEGVKALRAGDWYGTLLTLAGAEGSIPVKLAAEVNNGQDIPSYVDPNKAEGLPLVITQENLKKFPQFKGEFHA